VAKARKSKGKSKSKEQRKEEIEQVLEDADDSKRERDIEMLKKGLRSLGGSATVGDLYEKIGKQWGRKSRNMMKVLTVRYADEFTERDGTFSIKGETPTKSRKAKQS
jgi:hypothetical protein